MIALFNFNFFKNRRLRINDHILQVGEINVRSMDSTQISGVLRQPSMKMHNVKIIIARDFHILEKSDPNYIELTYEPFLIERSAITNNRAVSKINHYPIKTLKHRIEKELGLLAIADAKAEAELIEKQITVTEQVEVEVKKEV